MRLLPAQLASMGPPPKSAEPASGPPSVGEPPSSGGGGRRGSGVRGVLPRGGRGGAGELERRRCCSWREEVSAASLARLRLAVPALARTLSV
jgi:hypothetical protein